MLGFVLLWLLTLLSGVHATVAGVLAAMTIPVGSASGMESSPLHRLEHALHPWTAYLIVPLFGFANAGLTVNGAALNALFAPLSLGVALGLFLGKQLGVFCAIWMAVRLGIAARPAGASWGQVYGMAMLCGIGFTMSLFIGALAFPGQVVLIEEAKGGILLGSLASALMGYVMLRWIVPSPRSAVSGH